MRKRLNSLARLVEVQTQLFHEAEARLARLKREEAAIEEEKRELFAALNGDDALRGLFIDAAVRRLRALTDRGDNLRRAREIQEREALRHGGRLKQAQRMLRSAVSAARREEEKAMLLDVVESLASRASPRQA
jgi:hypothetical protein